MIYFEKLYNDFDNLDMPLMPQWKAIIAQRFYMTVFGDCSALPCCTTEPLRTVGG